MNAKKLKRFIRTLKNVDIYGCISTHQDHTAYIKLTKKQALETIPEWAVTTGMFPTQIDAVLGRNKETNRLQITIG